MLSRELVHLISRLSGVEPTAVIEHASLEDDLGITGDDAIELIIAFGKEFKVDVSNFMAADYFTAEGRIQFNWLKKMFNMPMRSTKKKMTVGHLQEAIRIGRLV